MVFATSATVSVDHSDYSQIHCSLRCCSELPDRSRSQRANWLRFSAIGHWAGAVPAAPHSDRLEHDGADPAEAESRLHQICCCAARDRFSRIPVVAAGAAADRAAVHQRLLLLDVRERAHSLVRPEGRLPPHDA